MTPFEVVAILLAGCAAGTINTIVGSGTLITFPTLLAFGIPPVTANVSNTVGLVPGSASAVVGYRAELVGQRPRLIRLASASLLGSVLGAVLLLVLPSEAFDTIVPALVALGVLLVVLGPRIQAWVVARADARGGLPDHGAAWVCMMGKPSGASHWKLSNTIENEQGEQSEQREGGRYEDMQAIDGSTPGEPMDGITVGLMAIDDSGGEFVVERSADE